MSKWSPHHPFKDACCTIFEEGLPPLPRAVRLWRSSAEEVGSRHNTQQQQQHWYTRWPWFWLSDYVLATEIPPCSLSFAEDERFIGWSGDTYKPKQFQSDFQSATVTEKLPSLLLSFKSMRTIVIELACTVHACKPSLQHADTQGVIKLVCRVLCVLRHDQREKPKLVPCSFRLVQDGAPNKYSSPEKAPWCVNLIACVLCPFPFNNKWPS
jgi:hypothetical protein